MVAILSVLNPWRTIITAIEKHARKGMRWSFVVVVDGTREKRLYKREANHIANARKVSGMRLFRTTRYWLSLLSYIAKECQKDTRNESSMNFRHHVLRVDQISNHETVSLHNEESWDGRLLLIQTVVSITRCARDETTARTIAQPHWQPHHLRNDNNESNEIKHKLRRFPSRLWSVGWKLWLCRRRHRQVRDSSLTPRRSEILKESGWIRVIRRRRLYNVYCQTSRTEVGRHRYIDANLAAHQRISQCQWEVVVSYVSYQLPALFLAFSLGFKMSFVQSARKILYCTLKRWRTFTGCRVIWDFCLCYIIAQSSSSFHARTRCVHRGSYGAYATINFPVTTLWLRPACPSLRQKSTAIMWPFQSEPTLKLEKVRDSYDYIIVGEFFFGRRQTYFAIQFWLVVSGAGSAGCVLASRLSENPAVSVLVIERGRPALDWASRVPIFSADFHSDGSRSRKFNSTPQSALDNKPTEIAVGNAFGGSSKINGMIYTRALPGQFSEWTLQGRKGWSYDELYPYFLKSEGATNRMTAENFHNLKGSSFSSSNLNSLESRSN